MAKKMGMGGAYESGASTGQPMRNKGKESGGRPIKQAMSPEGISNLGQKVHGTMADHYKAGRKMKVSRGASGEEERKVMKMECAEYPPHLMGGDDHGDYQVPSHGMKMAHDGGHGSMDAEDNE